MNKSKALQLHQIFNQLQRHHFPFDQNKIPQNGIYILFEKSEKLGNLDRIVRVGTHTGNNQLRSRLNQHFLNKNKDRSIFRKNIGRALLNKNNDPYLEKWEWDLTTRANKEKYLSKIDPDYQIKLENQVSNIIQSNFSFVVFEVNDKQQRLFLESRIISELSNSGILKPSQKWLGNHSPKAKIRQSGLWLVNELYKDNFSDDEFEEFIVFLRKQN